MKNLLIFAFLLLQSSLFAQSNKVLEEIKAADAQQDSRKVIALCEKLLSENVSESIKVEALAFQALHYNYSEAFDKAEASYVLLIAKAEKTLGKNHNDYIQILLNYSDLKANTGAKNEQYKLLENAYTLSKNKGMELSFVKAANSLGSYYEMAGAMEFAIRYFKEAVDAIDAAKLKGQEMHITTLHDLARALEIQHRYDESESTYNEAFALAKKTLDPTADSYVNLLNDFGMLYFFKRQYKQAIPYFKEIENLVAQKLIPIEENTTTLCNLADCYAHLKQYEEAEKLYNNMLAIDFKSSGESSYNYVVTISRLGDLYYLQGRRAEAEKMHLKAIALGEKYIAPQFIDRFYILEQAYLFFENCGEWEQARTIAMQSFELNCMDKSSIGNSLENIEKLAQTQSFATMPYSLKSLVIATNGYWQGYQVSGDAQMLKNAFKILSAIKILMHRLKNSFATEMDKLDLLTMTQKISELGINVAQKLHETTGDIAYQKASFSFMENNKYVLLQDALQARSAQSFARLPQELAKEETLLEQRLLMAKSDKIQALDEATAQEAVKVYNKALSDIDAFKNKIEKSQPEYFQFKYANETVKIEALQKQLKKGQALIEYFVGTSETHLFVLTKDKVNYLKLNLNKDSLVKQVAGFRRELSDYEHIKSQGENSLENYAAFAFGFYKQLLEPALKTLSEETKSLIIVPDGLLGHLPFEALLLSAAKKGENFSQLNYLINRYSVSYLYAASFLSNKQQASKNNHRILSMAADYKAEGKELAQRSANRSGELRSIRNNLQPLPAAQEEVNILKAQFDGLFLFGNDANEKTFKKEAQHYAVLHLAMHGLLNEKHPILSSLAFTENGDADEDNFLQAFEISQLRLNADLVVLSACETGYGKFQQGEGVMSLARSFMYAGVPSLVVSMWQVNDASTSAIMQLFYKNLSKGMNKAEALQQAKIDYIDEVGSSKDAINRVSNPMAAHPAFWAAFVLIGDDRPVAIATKNGGMIWWIAGGAGLLLLAAAFYFFLPKRKNG